MTCPGCLIALAGFGEDPTPSSPQSQVVTYEQLPPAAQSTIKGLGEGLWIMILTPAIASVVAATAGAVAWKQHRVIGGLLGFLLGGAVGGAAGAYFGAKRMRDALPSDQQMQDMGKSMQEQIEKALQQNGTPSAPMQIGPLKVDPTKFGQSPTSTAVRPTTSGLLSTLRLITPTTSTSTSTQSRVALPSSSTSTGTQSLVKLPSQSCPSGTTYVNGQCVSTEKRVLLPSMQTPTQTVAPSQPAPSGSSGGGLNFSASLSF